MFVDTNVQVVQLSLFNLPRPPYSSNPTVLKKRVRLTYRAVGGVAMKKTTSVAMIARTQFIAVHHQSHPQHKYGSDIRSFSHDS